VYGCTKGLWGESSGGGTVTFGGGTPLIQKIRHHGGGKYCIGGGSCSVFHQTKNWGPIGEEETTTKPMRHPQIPPHGLYFLVRCCTNMGLCLLGGGDVWAGEFPPLRLKTSRHVGDHPNPKTQLKNSSQTTGPGQKKAAAHTTPQPLPGGCTGVQHEATGKKTSRRGFVMGFFRGGEGGTQTQGFFQGLLGEGGRGGGGGGGGILKWGGGGLCGGAG